jgi:hypothetical protein
MVEVQLNGPQPHFCQPDMDENGEFLLREWNLRRALRPMRSYKPYYDNELGKRCLPHGKTRSTVVYIVTRPGDREFFCRDRAYASHLLSRLSSGFRPEDTMNERKWLLSEGRAVLRRIMPGSPTPHVMITASDVVLARFVNEIEASAWLTWYKARRNALSTRAPVKSSGYRYLAYTSTEKLDKTMDDRVYELLRCLTGTDTDEEPEE